jgi:hypothetical protein
MQAAFYFFTEESVKEFDASMGSVPLRIDSVRERTGGTPTVPEKIG